MRSACPAIVSAAVLLAGCSRDHDDVQGGASVVEASPSVPPAASRVPKARPRSSAGGDAGSPHRAPGLAGAPASSAVAPVGGQWLRCYSGFIPRTHPELDVLRLGMLCGPSTGMKRLSEVRESSLADDGGEREHRWQAKSGDCFRVFAVGAPSIDDLDVEILDSKGTRVAYDTTDDRWPIVSPDGPFCVFDDGEYRARVRAQRGHGRYAIQIWRLR